MSFTDTDVYQLFNADGVQVTFALNFEMIASNPDWIKVKWIDNATLAEVVKTKGTHYTLSPNEVNPVSVVFDGAHIPPNDQTVLVYRELPFTQPASFTNTGQFQKEAYETALDKFVMILQQVNERLRRSTLFKIGNVIVDREMPVPVTGKALKWADTAGNLENSRYDIDQLGDDLAAAIAAADADAAAAAASATAAASSASDAQTAQAAAEAAQAAAEAAAILAGLPLQNNYTLIQAGSAVNFGSAWVDTVYDCIWHTYVVKRSTTIFATGTVKQLYKNGAWVFSDEYDEPAGNPHGITWAVTGGQFSGTANAGSNASVKIKSQPFTT